MPPLYMPPETTISNPSGFARPNGRPSLCEDSQAGGGPRLRLEKMVHPERFERPTLRFVV
jgi:hypothetical protein